MRFHYRQNLYETRVENKRGFLVATITRNTIPQYNTDGSPAEPAEEWFVNDPEYTDVLNEIQLNTFKEAQAWAEREL